MSEWIFRWRVFRLGDRVQYALGWHICQALSCARERSMFNVFWAIKTQLPKSTRGYHPRPTGSGRKPGARVTNSALAFTYIRIMRCYIAQWHSGIKSRPIWYFGFGRWTDFVVLRMRRKRFCFANVTSEINGHFWKYIFHHIILKQNLVKKYPWKYCQYLDKTTIS